MSEVFDIQMTVQQVRVFRQMLKDYLAGKLTNRPGRQNPRREPSGERLAKVITADIAPNSEGDLVLCDAEWAEGPIQIKGWSDHLITIPVGTKCYVKRIQGKWRITTPIIECPGE